MRYALRLLLAAIGTVAVAAGIGAAWLLATIELCPRPCVDLAVLRRFEPLQASVVYDRGGVEIGRFYVEDRRVASLSQVPEHVRLAVLAVEDARFRRHRGVDWYRVVGAAWSNYRAGGVTQGASTITMQLARNVYPDALPPRERSYRRKLHEAQAALEIERALPKDTILQHYLNTIYFGSGAYGVDAAARRYFGKPIGALSLAEGALLAGLPPEPSRVNPFRAPELARRRRDLVLDRMHELGWLPDSAWRAAKAEPLALVSAPTDSGFAASARVGAYFIEDVRRELEGELGPSLYRAGFRIHTTLDANRQRVAERIVEAELAKLERSTGAKPRSPPLQGGVVVLDADSGDVLVMVGGRSFAVSPFNRMTQARRQPGSVFKTFVYAAALEQGWLPTDSVSDGAVAITMPAGNVWRPENYDRKSRNGVVSLESALAGSLNRATVRLGMTVGVSRVAVTARTMGLREPVAVRPATLLGAGEVRPIDLLAAYAPIARPDGHRLRPRTIVSVKDAHGHVLLAHAARIEPGLDPVVAARLRGMLVTAVERGTGRRVRAAGYEGPVAGKTGTTNGTTNAWFVGATPEYVAAVWVGYDLPRAILPDGSATGGRVAAPIWAEVMRHFPVIRSEWRQPEPAPEPPSPAEDVPAVEAPADSALVAPPASPVLPPAPRLFRPAFPPEPALLLREAWPGDVTITP